LSSFNLFKPFISIVLVSLNLLNLFEQKIRKKQSCLEEANPSLF